MRVIIMLLSCSLLGVAAEIPGRGSGNAPPPPVVDIPDLPDVQLPRLAALPADVRDRLQDQADAATRKVLVAAAQRIGAPETAARLAPPPLPAGGGLPAQLPPTAVGSANRATAQPVPPVHPAP